MNDLYKKAMEAYLEMVSIHIDTKTQDLWFHKTTEEFYDKLFSVAHRIWERYVDLGGKVNELSLQEKKKRANEIISNLLKDIEEYRSKNELTLGTDWLIWWLSDELEDIKWTSKAFLN